MHYQIEAHALVEPGEPLEDGLGLLGAMPRLIQKNPPAVGALVRDLLGAAGAAVQLGRPHDVTLSLLRAAKEAGVAAMMLAGAGPDEELVVSVGGTPLSVMGTGPTDFTEPLSWLRTYGLTLVLRDAEGANAICSLDVEILRGSPTRVDDFRYDLVAAMQDFWLGRSWRRNCEHARALAQPTSTHVAGREYVDVELTMLALLDPLTEVKAGTFNEALASSLDAHRAYWANKRWAGSPQGLLAITPLGLAAVAHDRGIPIEVESGYLPSWLVRGEFEH